MPMDTFQKMYTFSFSRGDPTRRLFADLMILVKKRLVPDKPS